LPPAQSYHAVLESLVALLQIFNLGLVILFMLSQTFNFVLQMLSGLFTSIVEGKKLLHETEINSEVRGNAVNLYLNQFAPSVVRFFEGVPASFELSNSQW